jgi:hypothetical protein
MGRIFGIIVLVAGVILGTAWYVHRSRIRALDSGDVFVREQPGDNAKPQTPPPAPTGQPAPSPEAATAKGAETPSGQPQTQPAAKVPSSDTISRNPPNGMTFSGSGKYQLYRQGDITWRLNTDTGWACVLFATDAQWRKTRVYGNGCSGRDAPAARGN